MAAEKTLLTADDLLGLPDADGTRYELVRGELRTMPPVNYEHAIITARLVQKMGSHALAHELGEVLAGDPGFRLKRDPDTVRAPDVAFFSAERLPRHRPERAFPDLVPDLVAEVISPSNTASEMDEKVQMWLEAGVRLVLLLYSRTRSITVYRSFDDVRVLTAADVLECGEVLPGFSCQVRELFPY